MSDQATPCGLLLVDKPRGWTSHDVVARVRRLYGTKKVGHAGTLDPMATGLLVVGLGRATKLLTFIVGADKGYSATIRLGQSTVTDDAEGEVLQRQGASIAAAEQVTCASGPAVEPRGVSAADEMTEPVALTVPDIDAAIADLTGQIAQVPSSVSAIKVAGQRAYARVRAGDAVELPARRVQVYDWQRETPDLAVAADGTQVVDLAVRVQVSSGTYVRALARDLGAQLGCGGHLTSLRRTNVGDFPLSQAHRMDELAARLEAGQALPLTSIDEAGRTLATRAVTDEQARALSYGQRIEAAQPGRTEPVAAYDQRGGLVAILDERQPTARSLVVITPASS